MFVFIPLSDKGASAKEASTRIRLMWELLDGGSSRLQVE